MIPSLKKEPTVGPGKYNPSAPIPQKPADSSNTTQSTIDIINKKLRDAGFPEVGANTGGVSLIDSLNNSQLELIAKILKNKNYTVKASAQYVKNLFLTETELGTILAASKGDYNTLLSNLASDILPGLAKGTKEAFTGPSRNVYKYSDEDVDLLIKDVYQKKLMRLPSEEELASFRKTVRPQLDQGTLSTTKLQKNKKTGVMEQVTVQEAGPTKEVAAQSIEEELKKLNPDEVDRTARIEFSSWLSQNATGA